MLIEIRSKVLRTEVVPFHAGLNVVLGDANATNSIGKSTMLMVVDFAFGGKDLLRHNLDVVSELGDHDYYFTFQFDLEVYRFRRGTYQDDVVYVCNEKFEPERTLTLDEYTVLLKKAYNIDLPDLSFRALVGLYTRVWGKDNLSVMRPLHVVQNQRGSECVDNLLKTFDRYATIRQLSKELYNADNKLRAWKAAATHKFIPAITKKAYEDNQKRIAAFEGELADIRTNLARYATNLSEVVNKEVLELKFEKDRLLALRLGISSRLQRVQSNLRENRAIRSENFRDLANYFPDINQDRLGKVEDFHNGVARLLRSELSESELQLKQELEQIDGELRAIDKRMSKILSSVEEPTLIVDRVYEVATAIGDAREENERFESGSSLRAAVKDFQERLLSEKQKILAIVENIVNDGMRRIVTERFGADRKSPHLTLRESGYSFEVDDDTGTGVAYSSLVIFDLTVFLGTKLPILIHDTVVFKNIENDSVARLLPVYIGSSKQSFVSLDEIEKYGSATADLLRQYSVIQLDNQHVLYVKDWRK